MNEKRLFDYLYDQLDQFPLEKAYGHKVDGQWQYRSTAEMVALVNRLSAGLLGLGLKPGDKVATVVHKTLPDWVALDFALLQIGVLNVPMYPTISAREYNYILNESEAQYCVVGEEDLYDKVRQAKATASGLKEIFTFFRHPEARSWETLMAPADADLSEVARLKQNIRLDDLATLIYTSGTTGNPKGVMLTHRNISFNVETMRNNMPLSPGQRGLSFLPVSHVFERVVVYAYTAYGASVTFVGTDNLGGETGDLRAVQPHFFTAVPRLLEKVYDKIYGKGLELRGLKRALFFWALGLTDDWAFDKTYSLWKRFQWRIAQKLIFSKWRAALGGHIRGIITGASACPERILRIFNAAGIPVREGYGLTEIAPGIAFSRFEPGGAMLGAVGPMLEGVTVRIDQSEGDRPGEGEILAQSPGVMEGYYKQPDKTAEMIRYVDGKRWLATGDVGTLVDGPGGQKFLKITDRKKDIFKTSSGKFIAPAHIEHKLKLSPFIDQCMVVGFKRPFVVALILPNFPLLELWCRENQVHWTASQYMVMNPKVEKFFQSLLDQTNEELAGHEKIRNFLLLHEDWTIEEGQLTPTLKLIRPFIEKKFESEIEKLYANIK